MEKLISMVAFVKEQNKIYGSTPFDDVPNPCHVYIDRCNNYANFLSEPLQLWMFVPTDENNVPLEEPLQEHYTDCTEEQNAKDWLYNLEKYQQAKERCYFEGFDYNIAGYVYSKYDKYNCRFDEESIENGKI